MLMYGRNQHIIVKQSILQFKKKWNIMLKDKYFAISRDWCYR